MAAGDFNVSVREDETRLGEQSHSRALERWAQGRVREVPRNNLSSPEEQLVVLGHDDVVRKHQLFQMESVSPNLFGLRTLTQRSAAKELARFEAKPTHGVSDHWPLAVDLLPQSIAN